MKKGLVFVLSCLMVLALTACPKQSTTSTPPPPSTFDQSLVGVADAINVVATGTAAVQSAAKNLLATQQISQVQYTAIDNAVKQIATKNEAARQLVVAAEAGDQTADWKTAILAVANAITAIDPTTFGIKNANAQATFENTLKFVDGTAAAILASYGGK